MNSLHFPIEILVQSRKLDLTPYLTKLKKKANDQTSELLKIQTLDYADFISELINMANIMKKRFYVVIGWENIELQKLSIVDKLLNRGNSISSFKISETDFKRHGDELRQKAGVIASGLGGIGLHCQQLKSAELISIFYNFYNPGIADKERLSDLENLQANIVTGKAHAQAEFDIEKPQNTADETPIIDNTDYVKEQDRIKKQAEAAERALGNTAAAPATENKTTNEKATPSQTQQQTQK